jgi:hypothetical protein
MKDMNWPIEHVILWPWMIRIGMVLLVDILSKCGREVWLLDEDCKTSETSRIMML